MTTVFVYEHCCALGLGRDPSDPAHSLYREGRAMRDAVAEDFRRIPGFDVLTFPCEAAPVADDRFVDAVNVSEWVLVIAPESGRVLESKVDSAAKWRAKLLGSSADGIRLTTDKLRLAEHWRRNGVPTPRTWELGGWPPDRFPVVWKPRDGAGSELTFRLNGPADVARCREVIETEGYGGEVIAQDFVPGRAVSVAFLVGPVQTVPLLPTFQILSSDGRFRYEGGELPIPPDLAERAIALGRKAIGCVPGLLGYVGVDLVLGDAAYGSRDYAIEINPRLTTSYVGLRELADYNLAEALLRVVNGKPVEPRWKPGRVRFRPDWAVSVVPTPGPTSG